LGAVNEKNVYLIKTLCATMLKIADMLSNMTSIFDSNREQQGVIGSKLGCS